MILTAACAWTAMNQYFVKDLGMPSWNNSRLTHRVSVYQAQYLHHAAQR